MNEQIQALAEEAGLFDYVFADGEVPEELEAFAQLIIERCCDAAWDAASSDESAEEVTAAIRAEFGDEE